ncbi:hypothetical protein A1O7_08529 [Cladophialophora yegresii CBS 114405]|uniref:Fucose-specific lectin n=1 Tax=Cladophialophora yegresii CBS 114405 TaxID=1182544 RepID=W9VTV6_9EURO|nr:uncharacterized protein A1O7_08529 [Cladophialophora yegresii CBS 114405]EXJ55601.1 hypothetical protein A1O7_08529 [Cladophialophora yegresii CBS 114405]
MSTVPSSLAFLSWGTTTGLVYTAATSGVVAWLSYTGNELTPVGQLDPTQYQVENAILINKKVTVEAHPGKVAAFHYFEPSGLPGQDLYQIRLFYIQKTLPSDAPGVANQIRLVCYTQTVTDFKGGKKSDWYRSPTFDDKKLIATADSPLTVAYDLNIGIVRLYYKKSGENKLRVVFTKGKPDSKGQDTWIERVAADKF